MYTAIDAFAARCIRLSASELEIFHSCLQQRLLRRREYLVQEGEICQWEAYIVKGCLRKYWLDEDGSEVNLQFALEDWWISDLTSFTEEIPSQLNIQALEDTEVLLIRHADKEELFRQIPAMERMFRLMVQRSLDALQYRFMSVLSQPAEQRYRDLLQRYPDFLQRIPQHHIASYLGMTPEFLSKVRRKLSQRPL